MKHRVPTGMNASASVLTSKDVGMHVNLFYRFFDLEYHNRLVVVDIHKDIIYVCELIAYSFISHPNFQPTHIIKQWAVVFSTHANFQPIVVGVQGAQLQLLPMKLIPHFGFCT